MKGVFISQLTQEEALKYLNEDAVVVLPLGGGSKEHGRHLPMGMDMFGCRALAQGITEKAEVVTLPMINYEHFPAFITWEGSINIAAQHFIDMVKQICRPFTKLGVRRFIFLDYSFSGYFPLVTAANELEEETGAKVAITRIGGLYPEAMALKESKQDGHAGEYETSFLMYTNPELVRTPDTFDEEYRLDIDGVRRNGAANFYVSNRMETPHGVNGDPTVANAEKGRAIVLESIETLAKFAESFKKMPIDKY